MNKHTVARSIPVLIAVATISCLSFAPVVAAAEDVATEDVARGAELSGLCTDCHGDDGLGAEEIPAIAGMSREDLTTALEDFKSGARVDQYESMVEVAADLEAQDIYDLAAYYSTLQVN